MAVPMVVDPVTKPRQGVASRPLPNGAEGRGRHDTDVKPTWDPALKLVESAARKIALYEQCFALLEQEARKTAEIVDADKRRMMRQIGELVMLLEQSEANHQQTLGMLAESTQVCALQRMEMRSLTQTLLEARSDVFRTTNYIKKLGLLVARAENEDSAKALLIAALQGDDH